MADKTTGLTEKAEEVKRELVFKNMKFDVTNHLIHIKRALRHPLLTPEDKKELISIVLRELNKE